MKNYLQNDFRPFFFFCFMHVMVVFPMELQVAVNDSACNPQDNHIILHASSLKSNKVITIFDSKKSDKAYVSHHRLLWSRVLPGSMLITPDDKGIVMSHHGKVKYCSFDTLDNGGKPKTIIQHHEKVEHFPMLAMAHDRDNGALLIVSAGNYRSSQGKANSEYILFSNGWTKRHTLSWPIQAITLASGGKTLAIAGWRFVQVIDLNEMYRQDQEYCKKIKEDNWIKDIVMNPKGEAMIVMESQYGLEWMTLTKKDSNTLSLENIKQVVSKDKIKNIYYPNDQELLYVTDDGEAKIIKVIDLLEPNDDNINTAKIINFSHSSFSEVTADPSEHIAVAHWSKNVDSHKIKIFRKNGECTEKFILEMPVLEKRYRYITDCGKYEEADVCLLRLALRDNRVVALTINGIMVMWSLPPMQIVVSNELDKDQGILEKIGSLESIRQKEKKRHSLARIPLWKTNRSHSSSRENSPHRHEIHRGDVKENSPKTEGKLEIKVTKAHADSHEDNVI